jgi:hypothetical protein
MYSRLFVFKDSCVRSCILGILRGAPLTSEFGRPNSVFAETLDIQCGPIYTALLVTALLACCYLANAKTKKTREKHHPQASHKSFYVQSIIYKLSSPSPLPPHCVSHYSCTPPTSSAVSPYPHGMGFQINTHVLFHILARPAFRCPHRGPLSNKP